MKAISTKYKGPTDTRGSKIIASDEDGNRVTISYPYELSGEEVHRKAAEALRDKMGWSGELIGGGTKTGYVFVFAPRTMGAVRDALRDLVDAQDMGTEEELTAAIDRARAALKGE